MWPDHESDVDFLNYHETAEIVSELVTNSKLRPVSVGVFGGWGSGKSTLIKLCKNILEEDSSYVTLDFDAWLYQDFDDARSALLEAVSNSLLNVAKGNETYSDKAKSLLKRVNKLRTLGLLAEGGALLMGMPAFGALNKGIEASGNIISNDADLDDISALQAATKDIENKVDGVIKERNSDTPSKEITAFREEFSSLLRDLNKTLVVYVDNLDRCLPKNTILTLEAIRLVLFLPNTAFVIAADEDMVRLAVADHYNTSQSRLINDYLDKLIQVPVYVPRLGVPEVTSYAFLLLSLQIELGDEVGNKLVSLIRESLMQLWNKPLISIESIISSLEKDTSLTVNQKNELETSFILARRLAPMLANSKRVAGNPRIIKRLLNTIWMRVSVASKRSMPTNIDKALIAKISLFERCVGNSASTEFYRLINESDDGKPELIKKLEERVPVSKEVLPESWEDVDFINSWLSLEPSLEGVDLRAVAYLARETLPMQLSVEGLSPIAETTIQALMKVQNLSSPKIKSILDKLPNDEYVGVIEVLIETLRKTTSWKKKPNGFVGALALAQKSTDAGKKFKLFITSLGNIPPWMKVMIKNEDWWTN